MVRATMPSSTGRQVLRKNLREAEHSGVENGDDSNDIHENVVVHANGRNFDRRASFAASFTSSSDEKDEKEGKKPTLRHSQSLVDALSDANSELAHFLLADKKDDDQGLFDGLFENNIFDNSMVKSMRNMTNRLITGENKDHKVGSLGTNRAWFYSLALEPMEVRRERIIMLAEAYAIFGALFLSGTWVLYEWGSGYGYGGCRYEETKFCHPAIDRAFEAVMTMAITANIFQAMFASFLWLMSILFSGSHRNWVYGARHLLLLCHTLLCAVFVLTVLSVALGIYSKLAPYWPELAVSISFLLGIVLYGMWATSNIAANEIPLEYYHFPLWFKWALLPFPMLRRGARQKIREAAEERAKDLKSRAFKERSMDAPSSIARRVPRTDIGALLRQAADSIDRYDFDVSKYEERLERDWYNDPAELKGMSVDVLSKYMPRRLAEEVRSQLLSGTINVHAESIGSGVLEEEGNGHRVSWKLHSDDDSD